MRPLYPFLLAALSGALVALAVTVTGASAVAFVALVPLLRAVAGPGVSARHALALGWTAGLVTQAVGSYWLVGTLVRFSGHPWTVALPLALAVWSYEGGRLALFAAVVRLARPERAWIAPCAWGALEWAYPLVLPWELAAGLSSRPLLVQLADLGGATLVSMLVVAVNAAVFVRLPGSGAPPGVRSALPVSTAAACLFAALYGAHRTGVIDAAAARAPKLRVGIVQPGVEPERMRAGSGGTLGRLVALSRALDAEDRPELFVWPESALPGAIEVARGRVRALVGTLDVPVLLGATTLEVGSRDAGLHNSALLVAPGGQILARHDKRRLLPFGEYVPLSEALPLLRSLAPNAGRFRPGRLRPPIALGSARVTALVCYEDVLPDLVRELVRAGNPNLLVNLTNDSWFGDTSEPRTHFALARLRAVEHRRALVRATQTGVSAVIDPVGRVVQEAPSFEPATLVAEVPLLAGATPFTTLGPWPAWLGALITLFALASRGRSRGVGAP